MHSDEWVEPCQWRGSTQRDSPKAAGPASASKAGLRLCCACRFFFLSDPSTNSVLGWSKTGLAEAEGIGFDRPEVVEEWGTQAAGDSKSERPGKVGCLGLVGKGGLC